MTETDYCLLYDIASKRIVELESKIADIKANCDLAIEGRDVKIKELEQQIEKMKCCQNCKHCAKIHDYDLDNEEDNNIEFCEVRCHEKSGWELKSSRMTDEEYFRKNYPDFCYGDKPLSPYWDLFQDGVEFGERQSETKIEELTSELTKKADTNHSLVEQMAKLEEENAELKDDNKVMTDNYSKMEQKFYNNLTKAKEILEELANMEYVINPPSNKVRSLMVKAEQFLKEIE